MSVLETLTEAQHDALDCAVEYGAVFAGKNVTKNGSYFRVNANTLRALERRGFLTLQIGPDGGMMGRLAPGWWSQT